MKKKKKKKTRELGVRPVPPNNCRIECSAASLPPSHQDDDLGDGGDEGEEAATPTGSGLPWDGTTRDYHYDELLGTLPAARLGCPDTDLSIERFICPIGRVFGILRENNPDLAGEKHKTILKPPQVPPGALRFC